MSAEGIKVCVRVRPFNKREEAEADNGGLEKAFTIRPPATIEVMSLAFQNAEGGAGGGDKQDDFGLKKFGYDFVFSSDPDEPKVFATQVTVYEAVGYPLLENALDAYNATMFAYGQTGAGKSHSVLGNPKDEEQKGILPRSTEKLFELMAEQKASLGANFTANVMCSYLEIYNENLSDLLATKANAKKLDVRLHPQHGPHVPGLTEAPCNSFDDINALLDFGGGNRIIAATAMNAQSSRSHAVFTVGLTLTKMGKESQSYIHFVDLAGSERQKKTAATGDRLKEGIAINQSLTALGRVIAALTAGKKGQVPPFRESKLTLLLKEALSGNSKTTMVAACSPSMFNIEETISTLEFASRCKTIKTSAKKNEVDRKDLIEALEAEKAAIEAQLKSEQDAREKVMDLVNQERAGREALAKEMEDIQAQLQRAKEIEARMAELEAGGGGGFGFGGGVSDELLAQIEAEKEALRLQHEAEKALMAQADDANKAQIEAHLLQLEAEMAEKEALAMERELAMAMVAEEQAEKERMRLEQEAEKERMLMEQIRYEEEREKIEADRRRVELELEANRAALAKSEQANRAELESAIKMLEDEQNSKLAMAAEREKAMEQVKAAEEERKQIEAERQAAMEMLAAERKRIAEADESKKKDMEEALKMLEEEQAEKIRLSKERSEALELVANAEREKARVQAEIEAERLRAKKELEEEKKKLADASQANKKDIEEAIKKLQDEQEAKQELDRQRVEALNKAAQAEQERLEIQRAREQQAIELQQERQKLAEASEENKKEVEAKIKQLEAERAEKETMAQERTEALAQVAKAEQERAKIQQEIQEERKRAQEELEKERAKLAQAEGAGKAEIEKAMARLEEEQKAKEALSRERAAALDKVAAAEEERAKIQKDKEEAQQALALERRKLEDAEEAAKEEINSAIRRLEQEQEAKNELAKERAAALEQVANAERERAAIQAERDRMQKELQEQRVALMEAAGSNDQATQEALKKLEAEQAERARISREREEALEKVSQAENERAQIQQDREKAIQERLALEAKLASADEAARAEIEETLKKLQEAQAEKDKANKERYELLQKIAKEQQEKEDILQQKAEEKAKAEKEAELRRKVEEDREKAVKEKNAKQAEIERLTKEKADQEAKESELKAKFEELERKQKETEDAAKMKMEEEVERRLKEEAAREEEMQARIADLQSRLESRSATVDQDAIDKRAREQFEEMKKATNSKSGAGNLSAEEQETCPFITKLTTETTQGLGTWKVFIDPKEMDGVTLGSDEKVAKIQVGGIGINALHCRLWARDECKEVYVQAEEGAILRVNGEILEPGKEKQCRDGDRISLGRSAANASFFEVEIPKARNHGLRDQKAKDEENLLKAMEEVENSIELDDKTKEIVQVGMDLIKQKFGVQEANFFLDASKRASAELLEANEILKDIDEELRGGVEEYELAVLFDTRGFPILSVIARRKPQPPKMQNMASRVSRRLSVAQMAASKLFGNADVTVSNTWTLSFFRDEILPWLREAQFSIQQEDLKMGDDEDDEGWDWRLQVWTDVPMRVYKKVWENRNKFKKKATKSAITHQEQEEEEADGNLLPWWLGGGQNSGATGSQSKPESSGGGGGSGWWGGLLGMLGNKNESSAPGLGKGKASIKQFTKGMIKAAGAKETKKKNEKVTVPKLLDGKLGVKLKNGMHVVGFDHPSAKDFGWALHDEIVEVNGKAVTNRDTFAAEYSTAKKTMPIVFTVQREIKPAKRKPSVLAEGTAKKKDDSTGSSMLDAPANVSAKLASPRPKNGASSSSSGKGTKNLFDNLKSPSNVRKESKGMKEGVSADVTMFEEDIPLPPGAKE